MNILEKKRPFLEGKPDELDTPDSCHVLDQPVEILCGVGPRFGAILRDKGYGDVKDLLWLLPVRYEDRRFVQHIRTMAPGVNVQGIATVKSMRLRYVPRVSRWIYEVVLEDGTGDITAKWFLGSRKRRPVFRIGQRLAFTGRLAEFQGRRELHHPDVETMDPKGKALTRFGMILPIYPKIEGIPGPVLRKVIRAALHGVDGLLDPLPMKIRIRCGFPSLSDALMEVHIPQGAEDVSTLGTLSYPPLHRLIFDEFFMLQMALRLKRRTQRNTTARSFPMRTELLAQWKERLPFHLTQEQENVLEEIRKDLERSYPMNRLLHGEVGSGKTVLALLAAAIVALHGKQTVFLVPTEVLVFQLERIVAQLRDALNLRPVSFKGGMPERMRRGLLKKIESGEATLILGTHAVLQKDVAFPCVGLIVVDEQHRFGVMQKAALQHKAHWPHVLVMSATPIPRTLALTVYGDLDVSTLRLPLPGRKQVATVVVPCENRYWVYAAVRREVESGGSVYWIVPRIDTSETEGMKNLETLFRELSGDVFPDLTIASIHGDMPSDEKQRIMGAFQKGTYNILVATTLVEVGLDMPDATLIIVEHPECFGLAQLHQLRGRIGRGTRPGYCYLMLNTRSTPLAQKRLEIFQNTHDGFDLAEKDLQLRGPGEFLGTRQTGFSGLRTGDFLSHHEVLEEAHREVNCILQEDPYLQMPEHQLMALTIHRQYGELLSLSHTY